MPEPTLAAPLPAPSESGAGLAPLPPPHKRPRHGVASAAQSEPWAQPRSSQPALPVGAPPGYNPARPGGQAACAGQVACAGLPAAVAPLAVPNGGDVCPPPDADDNDIPDV